MNNGKEIFMCESIGKEMDIITAMDDLFFREDDAKWNTLTPLIANNENVKAQIEEYLVDYYQNHDICVARAYCFAFFLLTRSITVGPDDGLLGSALFNKRNRAYPEFNRGETEELLETDTLPADEVAAFQEAKEMWLFFRCPGGHTIPNYGMLLSCGYEGLIQKIQRLLNENEGCAEKADFYLAELIACRAAQYLIIRYRDALRGVRVGEEKNFHAYDRRYDICDHISHASPRNFEEAVQLLWFAHECAVAEGNLRGLSLGRMDQYLYPYYEQDVRRGIINKGRATDIICQLWQVCVSKGHVL